MVTHSKQSPIELAFTLLRSLYWYLSHIWNIWCQIYQISYKIIFITKELTKNTIVFFKKPLKSKFKISKVEKEEELGRNIFGIERHSNKKNSKHKLLCKSDLKEQLKNEQFFSCDWKGNIPRHISFQRQRNTHFCRHQFFLTPRNSLAVSITRTDTFWIRNLWQKIKNKKRFCIR